MSFGKPWTSEDVKALKKEYKKPTITWHDAIRKLAEIRTLEKASGLSASLNVKQLSPKKKPLLNKTETMFFAELQRRGHQIILPQALTFKLADGLTYRPDFVTVEFHPDPVSNLMGTCPPIYLTCYETKGPHRFKREGINKLKMAASKYPFVKWILIERDGKSWSEKEMRGE